MNVTDGPHPIYLASRSPRRQELLTQLGKCYVGNMVDTTYSLVAKVAKDAFRPVK